jgi:hypothetical protein
MPLLFHGLRCCLGFIPNTTRNPPFMMPLAYGGRARDATQGAHLARKMLYFDQFQGKTNIQLGQASCTDGALERSGCLVPHEGGIGDCYPHNLRTRPKRLDCA